MNFTITSTPTAKPQPAAPAGGPKNFTITSTPQAQPQPSSGGGIGDVAAGAAKALTSSEVNFGNDLSTLIPGAQNTADKINAQTSAGEQKLLEAAHHETDPAKRSQILDSYQKIYGKAAPVTAGDINPAFNKTPLQVAGDAAGVALDVASAGSYGEAAKGAETGKLLTKTPSILPAATDAAKSTLGDTLKGIGKKALVRSATGAGVGYGYDVSQNLQNGKTGADALTPGAGTATGAILPIGLGSIEAGAAVTKENAPRIINSLVKPKAADFAYGKNPGRTVAALGITGNSLEDFAKNIGAAKNDVGKQISSIYANPANAAIRINGNDAVAKIDSAIAEAAKGGKNNQGVVTTLQNIKDALLYDHSIDGDGNIVKTGTQPKDLSSLSPEQAFELKSLIADQTKFTGRASDDKTVNAVLKQMYGDLKGKLNDAVGANNPEIKDLNQKYADLTSAELATKNRDAIVQRSNMVSMPVKVGGVAGLITALGTGGAGVPAVLAAVGAGVLDKAMESTAVKSRVAAWLGSESPSVIRGVLQKNPEIKTVLLRTYPKLAAQLAQPSLPPYRATSAQ